MGIDLNDYIAGGYFACIELEGPGKIDKTKWPPSCNTQFFPDYWAVEWANVSPEKQKEEAAIFGVSSPLLPTLIKEVTQHLGSNIGWPNMCFNLETVRLLVSRFCDQSYPVSIFGLGLHRSILSEFSSFAQPSKQQEGFAPVGETGVLQAINRENSLNSSGQALGIDILRFEKDLGFSWYWDEVPSVPLANDFAKALKEARRQVVKSNGDIEFIKLPWAVMAYA